ncbi:MAG: ABC transporter ATP-binding protein [Acidobacteria bacterium]|nr:MAG: ABC transporter ATP-binding protein [Acidobacteriota bacterium]
MAVLSSFEAGVGTRGGGRSEDALVRLDHVGKRYQDGQISTEVLTDVDMRIERGSFTVVLGVSGSGKTTLLNLVAGLDVPSSGEVFVDGRALSALSERARTEFRRTAVGIVFQYYNLLPTLTALENIEAALEITPLPAAEIRERSWRSLEAVGLGSKASRFPSQLSGGEQQRVAIARALAKEPALIVADEPTGNLDEQTGRGVMTLLQDLRRRHRATLVVATHNPEMTSFADRVVRIEHGRMVDVPILAGAGR